MKLSEFQNKVKKYPFFHSHIFAQLTDNVPMLRRQMSEWVDKGWVIQLKRGIYTLPEQQRTGRFSNFFLANYLYTPSYISLESALSYYGLIPEGVYATTSISTKKTQKFTNLYGKFYYSNIKKSIYGNYRSIKDEFGNAFNIATKEKALFDFIYLKSKHLPHIDSDVFELSWRLQNLASLDTTYLMTMTEQLNIKKMNGIIGLLIKWMETNA